MQFHPIHKVLQKSFSQLPLPTTSPFFTGFIFCHIKHKLFTLLLIAYHFYSPFTYEVNFCLLSIKDASSTTYLYLLKDVGLGSAVFLGFFFLMKGICYPYTYRKLTIIRLSVCWGVGPIPQHILTCLTRRSHLSEVRCHLLGLRPDPRHATEETFSPT